MIKGLITALRTLSMLPVPGKDADNLSTSLIWFPLVGLLLGGMLYEIAIVLQLIPGMWPGCNAVIILIGGVLLTRAMHLDGLADWADGFGGGTDKQKILQIMKDPHSGVFGVIAVVVILLIKWVILCRLIENGAAIWIIPAYVVSRTIQVELASSLPYARPEGGKAAPFVNGSRFYHRLIAFSVALIILLIVNGIAGILALCIGWIMAKIHAWWCKQRVGGITGDLIGAGSEIVETGILMLMAIFINSPIKGIIANLPHLL